MQKGNIGVTTENIFPVIKKFLYSDHEIFLREMVSNAVDATQKMKTLAAQGEFKDELGDLTVRVNFDAEKGTITISDHGIGMTEEEIDKYINQIAFSGVSDFLEKYKDNANNIIGHFGLGFYSSFMVSKKVEIITKSYKEGSKAVSGAAMVVLPMRSTMPSVSSVVLTLSFILMMTARNSSTRASLKGCSTSTASLWPSLWPSARNRSGVAKRRRWLIKMRTTLLIM